MKNSHRYFKNHECKYFPCHEQPSKDEFNCLFCYCPLYYLPGDNCGGNFEYVKTVKACMGCHLPHMQDYYDVIVEKIIEANSENPSN